MQCYSKSNRRSEIWCPVFNWQSWQENSLWCLMRETSRTTQNKFDNPKKLSYHQSIFEKLNDSMIRKSALKTHRSHGPSGQMPSFKSISTGLCKTIAKLGTRIATFHLKFFLPYNSCWLIALDKCLGVGPIGNGAVHGRNIESFFW